jgi:hypothetical protein
MSDTFKHLCEAKIKLVFNRDGYCVVVAVAGPSAGYHITPVQELPAAR